MGRCNGVGELYRLRSLDLFAGVGGGLLFGTILGWESVCAVEIDDYYQQVLSQRQKDGALPWFPIWDNIRDFDGTPWRGLVDVVTGGFPCQPYSCAGKRKGEMDERNLWPDTIRVIREVRPRYCLLENVPGLASPRGSVKFLDVIVNWKPGKDTVFLPLR